MRRLFPTTLLVCGLMLPAQARELPVYSVTDPAFPVLDEERLIENERFWPYKAALREPLQTPTGRVPARIDGVLTRIDEAGKAHLDFGRDGRHEVPIEATDLVERANRVRLGTERKFAPNFVHAIGPRLVDASGEAPEMHDFSKAFEVRAFLAIYAPVAELPALAKELGALHGRNGITTILFPQGDVSDRKMHATLRELEWGVPFLLDAYSEPYTKSRWGAPVEVPKLSLVSPEGRVIHRTEWGAGAKAEMLAAMDQHFGPEQDVSMLEGETR